MSISIIAPGVLASVQDLGRFGYRADGVTPGGALDDLALIVGNRLVGNARDAAAIEFTFGNARLRFDRAANFALTGAHTDAHLDGAPIAPWRCATAHAGSELVLGIPSSGVRTLLTVRGGIEVVPVLRSRSTDLAAAFGGHDGRALCVGDILRIGEGDERDRRSLAIQPPSWALMPGFTQPKHRSVRALVGEHTLDTIWQRSWSVQPASNRMGLRLRNDDAPRGETHALASRAVHAGMVQIPPDGAPIVLLAEAQTTGGYPIVATVIAADRWRLAQLRAADTLAFVRVSLDEARAAAAAVESYLHAIDDALGMQ